MMGFGGGAVTCMKVVVAVLVLVDYGVSVAWGQYSQAGWLNIDCGSTAKYTDPVTGINWEPDDPYITNVKLIGTISGYSSFSEAKTLRYFDGPQAKNCYKLPVIAKTPYMLRATFFYAGYDNASTPPTFELAIDGTVFAQVTGNLDIGVFREVFYVAQSNVTFLCLIRDPVFETVPFISAITLKRYSGNAKGFDEYLAQNRLIRTEQRVNFGGNKLLRYPDDPFDRYWFYQETNTTYLQSATPLQLLTTTQPIANTKNDSFFAPWPVLQDGLTTKGNITIFPSGGDLGSTEVFKLAEVALQFAELDPNANITTREFYITVPREDGPQVVVANPFNFTDPPAPYTAHTWYIWDLVDFGPTTTITLSPTPNSIEGPIINGMEVFSITEPVVLTTTPRDALAIEAIKVDMNLTEWTGDPCLPVPHNWVNCTVNVQTQRQEITAVDLSRYKLNGTISPSFAKLEALMFLSLTDNALTGPLPDLSTLTTLKILSLENNMLSGPLPNWLTSMKRLTELSVQNNNFSGEIPSGLVGANNLQFTYQPGNPQLIVGSPKSSSSSKSSSNIGIIVGAILGGLVGLAALVTLVVCCCIFKSRANVKQTTKPEGAGLPDIAGAKAYSFAQVAAATNNFKRKIGSGGFGPVYYGKLPGGQEVAVKVADSSSHQGAAEFYNEVELMTRVHHRNLVSLVGYCQEGANQILIYEFIELGSLHDHLFGTSSKNAEPLNWNRRLNIAVNAAQGLEYLHKGCIPGIIHRDVKSSNILLTSKADIAKMADFGLSKLTGDENATHVSTLVKGTAGYLDPEYFQTNLLTFKSDVYSFGVVLLELMTGQPPVNAMTGSLIEWVRENLSAGDFDKILDPAVKASHPNLDSLWKVAEVAMNCVEPKGVHRPIMSEVIQELRAALALEPTHFENSTPEVSSNDVSVFLGSGSIPSVR